MVTNDEFQAAVVAKLKANSALSAWLTDRGAGAEIREIDYQGASFIYPNIRVGEITMTPAGDQVEGCATAISDATFTIVSSSEDDSSKNANILAGIVDDALQGKRIYASGFKSLVIQLDGLTGATRSVERIWQTRGLYRARIYETT